MLKEREDKRRKEWLSCIVVDIAKAGKAAPDGRCICYPDAERVEEFIALLLNMTASVAVSPTPRSGCMPEVPW